MGFDAKQEDLVRAEVFPRADICIMMGSLYHFFPDAGIMLGKMFRAADKVVISEPVLNLSSRPGLIGFLAKRATSVGKRQESFRYNRVSIMKMLNTNSGLYGFEIAAVMAICSASVPFAQGTTCSAPAYSARAFAKS